MGAKIIYLSIMKLKCDSFVRTNKIGEQNSLLILFADMSIKMRGIIPNRCSHRGLHDSWR